MSHIFKDLLIFVDRKFFNNTYMLIKNGNAIIIDPSYNNHVIEKTLQEQSLKLIGIILTHAHYDHVGDTFALAKKYHLRVHLHNKEKPIVEQYHCARELNCINNIDLNNITYFNDDILFLNDFNLKIFLLPGHTPGGIGIRYHDYFFSGDTLFYNGIGRTDLPLGNISDMKQTLQLLSNTLKDDEWVFPGHGSYGKFKDIKNNLINIQNSL